MRGCWLQGGPPLTIVEADASHRTASPRPACSPASISERSSPRPEHRRSPASHESPRRRWRACGCRWTPPPGARASSTTSCRRSARRSRTGPAARSASPMASSRWAAPRVSAWQRSLPTRRRPPTPRPARSACHPGSSGSGFFVAPGAARFYRGVLPWHGAFPYDPVYYNRWYGAWPSSLPNEELLRQGLPEGVLQPGGRVAGFLYFKDQPKGTELSFYAVARRRRCRAELRHHRHPVHGEVSVRVRRTCARRAPDRCACPRRPRRMPWRPRPPGSRATDPSSAGSGSP